MNCDNPFKAGEHDGVQTYYGTTMARKTDWGHFSAGHSSGQGARLNRGVGGMPAQGLLS